VLYKNYNICAVLHRPPKLDPKKILIKSHLS
jgi:hypothetical protein